METFIDGRELEVAVLGNRELEVAPVGEIIKAEDVEYYDYETKYLSDSEPVCAFLLIFQKNLQAELQSYAMRIYRACGCAGLSRVDFFWDRRDGKVYLMKSTPCLALRQSVFILKLWLRWAILARF